MNLQPITSALIGKEHDVMVRRGDEHMLDKIVFARCRSRYAFTSAALTAIAGNREALDKAIMRDRHDYILFGDHVLNSEILCIEDDLCATLGCILCFDFRKFISDDLHLKFWRCKY